MSKKLPSFDMLKNSAKCIYFDKNNRTLPCFLKSYEGGTEGGREGGREGQFMCREGGAIHMLLIHSIFVVAFIHFFFYLLYVQYSGFVT